MSHKLVYKKETVEEENIMCVCGTKMELTGWSTKKEIDLMGEYMLTEHYYECIMCGSKFIWNKTNGGNDER